VGRSPRQPKVKLISDPAGAPAASTREFHYQSDAIVEERLDGVTTHRYLVDEGGSIVEVIIPSGANAGTCLSGGCGCSRGPNREVHKARNGAMPWQPWNHGP